MGNDKFSIGIVAKCAAGRIQQRARLTPRLCDQHAIAVVHYQGVNVSRVFGTDRQKLQASFGKAHWFSQHEGFHYRFLVSLAGCGIGSAEYHSLGQYQQSRRADFARKLCAA
jgi:hypothetical protein